MRLLLLKLNNVSGPSRVELQVAIPAEQFEQRSLVSLQERIAELTAAAAAPYLTSPDTIQVILDDLETAHTFAVKFEVNSYPDKRDALSLVRQALLPYLKFADRASITANLFLDKGN